MSNIFNTRFLGINSDISRAMERLRDAAQTTVSYPKYNLYTSDDGNHVLIEIAIAGFSKNDITITQDSRMLTIKGEARSERNIGEHLISRHRGISNKDFCLSWNINNGLEVESAEISDGILTVVLQAPKQDNQIRVIPVK